MTRCLTSAGGMSPGKFVTRCLTSAGGISPGSL